MAKKIIAICNQKGGVGKTFTTNCLGVELSQRGYKVLSIDGDQQANLTTSFGIDPDSLDFALDTLINGLISGESSIELTDEERANGIHRKNFDAEVEVPLTILSVPGNDNLDILPASIDLAGVDLAMMNAMQREFILKKLLVPVQDNYDYIIIDSPPALGLMIVNILTAATDVLIPMGAAKFSVSGMGQLIKSISDVKRNTNPAIEINGILFTMVAKNTNFGSDITSQVRERFGEAVRVYQSEIPRSIKAEEAIGISESILVYDPRNPVAVAYRSFVDEFLAAEEA